MVLCLEEHSGRFLFFILLMFFIQFCSSFCCCCSSFHFCFSFALVVVVLCFSTSSLSLLLTIARFLHPFYIFSPAHCRVICGTFIFNLSGIFFHSFTMSVTVSSEWGFYYPQAFLTIHSFTDIFLHLSRTPREWAVLP